MRAKLYLIAAALFQQPDADLLLRVRELALLLQRESSEYWGRLLLELAQPAVCDDDLIAEYTRLFVLGTPKAAVQPFASCWLEREGRLMGKTTQAIREMMAAHGLRASGGFLPDHIVSELEFMAWLADCKEPSLETQRRLLTEHLARWTPLFTAALREARPSSRFVVAAEFLDRLVGWDLGNFESNRNYQAGHPLSPGATP